MLSLFYKYIYSDYDLELKTITKQRRLRHLLHRQIVTSKLKLKSVKPLVKTGIWELDKHCKISVPKFDEVVQIDKSTKKRKRN